MSKCVLFFSLQFQLPPECTIYRPCFHFCLSAVQNRFKYRQNAPFAVFVFILFSTVPNRLKYRHNACFRDFVSIYFSAVPNRFKLHQSTCFRDIVFISSLQSKSFQVLSKCMKVQRPICDQYILNTERKVFNYLWFNFVV